MEQLIQCSDPTFEVGKIYTNAIINEKNESHTCVFKILAVCSRQEWLDFLKSWGYKEEDLSARLPYYYRVIIFD